MNKKGLILIFLFVVSALFVVSSPQAATDNQVEVTLKYVPSAYVPMGQVYVEFDRRFLDDNMVFGIHDTIYFAFYYDVCIETWGGAVTTGGGVQPENWFYDTPDPNSTCLYTETRFIGTMNVMLDNYDMGMSNFDIGVNNGNYQDIVLKLKQGWHYMTIIAAELVSDCNHTTWEWQYAKDDKKFYVALDKDDTPLLLEDAWYNTVDVTTNAVHSENLKQWYDWTSFESTPRPVAEAVHNQYATATVGNESTPIVTDITVQYNASNTLFDLADTAYGLGFGNIFGMGPLTYLWIVNNKPADIAVSNITYDPSDYSYEPETLSGFTKGQNYIYFVLFGFKTDDFAMYWTYGDTPAPQLACDTAIFSLYIGPEINYPEEPTCPECTTCPEPTPGFGIFISVSMLGLAAVLIMVRKRK